MKRCIWNWNVSFFTAATRTRLRCHLLREVTWLFCSKDARLLRSFMGGLPPLLTGVRDFLFPYVNSEGFHLRTVSRSRRGYLDVFCSSVWRVSTLFRDLRILFTRPAVIGSLTYFLSLENIYIHRYVIGSIS